MQNKGLLILLFSGFFATQAYAVPITSGYGVTQAYRDCTVVSCAGTSFGPATTYTKFVEGGTSRVDSRTTATDPDAELLREGLFDPANVGLGIGEVIAPVAAGEYPELRAYAQADAGRRLSVNMTGVQQYVNSTSESILLNLATSITGTLTREDSIWTESDGSTAGSFFAATASVFRTPFVDVPSESAVLPQLFSTLCLFDVVTSGQGFNCANQPPIDLLFTDTLLVNPELTELPLGESLDFAEMLGSFSYLLAPGETIWVGASLTAIGQNGGTVDSLSTFNTSFVDAAGNPIALDPVARVPEPSTGSLLACALALLWYSRRNRSTESGSARSNG